MARVAAAAAAAAAVMVVIGAEAARIEVVTGMAEDGSEEVKVSRGEGDTEDNPGAAKVDGGCENGAASCCCADTDVSAYLTHKQKNINKKIKTKKCD
jgi:hypothetical protein